MCSQSINKCSLYYVRVAYSYLAFYVNVQCQINTVLFYEIQFQKMIVKSCEEMFNSPKSV